MTEQATKSPGITPPKVDCNSLGMRLHSFTMEMAQRKVAGDPTSTEELTKTIGELYSIVIDRIPTELTSGELSAFRHWSRNNVGRFGLYFSAACLTFYSKADYPGQLVERTLFSLDEIMQALEANGIRMSVIDELLAAA